MAVALATLPLKSELAGDGDTFLTTGVGGCTAFAAGLAAALAATLVAGFATGLLTGFTASFAGKAAFLTTGLGVGFAAFPLTAWPLPLMFLAATFFDSAVLATGFFAAAGLAAVFFATGFPAVTFLTAIFLASTFFAIVFFATGLLATIVFFDCGLLAVFLVAALVNGLATGFLATPGLAAVFLITGLAALLVTAFFAGVLLALFTACPFVAATFDLLTFASCGLVEAFPLCALAALVLRVVFAISLTVFWPWRPGVIAYVSRTSKLASGILVPLHPASRPGNVNILTRLILWLLRLYKRGISPLLGPRCRFHPSCSDYARIAVSRFGPWRGSLLTGWRLLRCQPLCTGGEDPVPEHFHFPRCHCQDESSDPH